MLELNLFYLHETIFAAFSGDITCDFESPHWDNGFCNWQYDVSSKDVLELVEAPLSDLDVNDRWKYGNILKYIFL